MIDKTIFFWFDIRKVSGTHAEVAANIAGLALALLLIVPVFSGDNLAATEQREVVDAMLDFLFALVYGILASFAFSALSGDVRGELDRLLTFVSPAVAFGVSANVLFLGFFELMRAHLAMVETDVAAITNIIRTLNTVVLLSIFTIGARTVVGMMEMLAGMAKRKNENESMEELDVKLQCTDWMSSSLMKAVIFPFPLLLLAVALLHSYSEVWDQWLRDWHLLYFEFLIVLLILCVVHYALSSYVVIDSHNSGKMIRLIKVVPWVLLFCFGVVMLWTFALLLL